MADIKICRICLRHGIKLFHYRGYKLKLLYEELLNVEIVNEDKLPRYFCFECAAMLYKYHKFKAKCHQGQKILIDVIGNDTITQKTIRKLNVIAKELKSQLDVMNVNERVKTIEIKSEINLQKQNKFNEIFAEIKSEEQIMTNGSSVDENNETVCKKEENEIKDAVAVNNSITIDCIHFNVDKIDEDVKMINDDDRDLSSDDDVLSSLKNKTLSKIESNEDTRKVLKVNRTTRKRTKEKRVQNKKAKEGIESRKHAKKGLDSQFWERKQLTEEEAREEFRKRAVNPKYLAASYQCTNCYRGFSQEDMLIRHNRKKHAETIGAAVCSFCACRFRLGCQLRRHLRQHYDLYKCLRCNLVCNLEMSALFHEEHHNGVVKKCAHCGEEFTHTSTYYSHLRSHRSEFVCTLCGQSFVSETGLRYHKTLKHAHMDTPEQTQRSGEDEADTYCERCKIRFETREAYDQHYLHSAMHSIGTSISGPEDVAAPALTKARDKVLVRRPREPTTCQHCQTTFRTKRGYQRHPCVAATGAGGAVGRGRGRGRGRGWVQLHPERKPPQSTGKKEMCEICGATVGALYMRAHINTHTHQRVYTCDTCGARTHSQSSHRRHQLTHTGEKPYPCPLCDKRFTQSNSMKLHYRTFHLKEPYPKRNRKKEDTFSLVEFSALQSWTTNS